MYKVVMNYEPEDDDAEEYLRAEKGDILIDGEAIDEEWFRGKNAVSEKYGKIRRSCIAPFSLATQETRDQESKLQEEDVEKQSLASSDCDGRSDEESAAKLSDKEEQTDDDEASKKREANYVDMMSVKEGKMKNSEGENGGDPQSSPSCVPRGLKTSDDGYNSASYYSGEPNESNVPLLIKPSDSKQDEAGYEVPQIHSDSQDQSVPSSKSKNDKGKRKLFRSIFRTRSMNQEHDKKNSEKQPVDDIHEKYYNPPADIRNNYFSSQSRCPITRVLLSLIVALSISFTALFVLIISLHPLLSFTISFVLFIVIFVTPVTLLHQGFLCVIALVFPSLFSTRTKIATLILLLVLLILGPILGIVDKLYVGTSCKKVIDGDWNGKLSKQSPTIIESYNSRRVSIQEECITSFVRVNTFCNVEFERFQRLCLKYKGTMNSIDERLCAKSKFEFCQRNASLHNSCLAYVQPKIRTADHVRSVFLYLLPLLFLLLLSDAYLYNKVYLTTKNADNIYITHRLKELDCERKHRGLTDLILPLTRIEFQTYLLRGRMVLSKLEKLELLKWLGILLLAGFVTAVFLLLEDSFHSTLLKLQVDQCKTYYESNARMRYRLYIYILLAVLLFVIILQSYALRLRSIICDHFYPDMVDIRAKHLYYKILHDRHSFARHIRRKIQLRSESKRLSQRISCASMVFQILPERLRWLLRKLSIRRCMICDSLTYYKTVECAVGECQAHYCYECFVDAGQICLTCKMPNSPPPTVPIPVPV